jgi:hypothetical protein
MRRRRLTGEDWLIWLVAIVAGVIAAMMAWSLLRWGFGP